MHRKRWDRRTLRGNWV